MRIERDGWGQYKKGDEVRLVADSEEELRLIRCLLLQAGFQPGSPFTKGASIASQSTGRKRWRDSWRWSTPMAKSTHDRTLSRATRKCSAVSSTDDPLCMAAQESETFDSLSSGPTTGLPDAAP